MSSHPYSITYNSTSIPNTLYLERRGPIFLKAVAVGGLFYLIKKVIEVISTRPLANPQNYTKREHFYAVCANFREGMERKIGEENWEAFNCVILDNAWFAAFFVSLIPIEGPPFEKGPSIHATIRNGMRLATFACSMSFGAWLLRTVVATRLPSCLSKVTAFIAPKGFPQARL